jgi:hypothetical protein
VIQVAAVFGVVNVAFSWMPFFASEVVTFDNSAAKLTSVAGGRGFKSSRPTIYSEHESHSAKGGLGVFGDTTAAYCRPCLDE